MRTRPISGDATLPPCRLLYWAPGASAKELLHSLLTALDPSEHLEWIELWTPDPVWHSTEEALTARGCAKLAARIHQRCIPEGARHWIEVLHSSSACAGLDVAWLVAGTSVAVSWSLTLRRTLLDNPDLASCSPLCLGEPHYSPFAAPVDAPTALEPLQRWLQAHAPAEAVDLGAPLYWAGCMRAGAVNDAAALALHDPRAPERWFTAWSQRGWLHASSRRACVQRPPDGANGSTHRLPTLLADPRLWKEAHPLLALRLDAGLARQRAGFDQPLGSLGNDRNDVPPGPAAPCNPLAPHPGRAVNRLHIMHSWGGGLSKWVQDFCAEDFQMGGAVNLILRSVGGFGAFGQRLELRHTSNDGPPLHFWELGVPIHATALAHAQYRSILDSVLKTYRIGSVIVSSLIGHSLDALRSAVPTLLVAHDHYPFCLALYASFGGACHSCGGARLNACIRDNLEHRFFKGINASDWEDLQRTFVQYLIEHRVRLIAPSPSVAARWKLLMPSLQRMNFHLIPHGIHPTLGEPFTPEPQGRLKVVALGRLTREKGAQVLLAAVEALASECDFLLLGCGEAGSAMQGLQHVSLVPDFAAEDLPRLLAGWKPHLALQLSVVPETFSYALSELWRSGIPVVASDLGAFSDRIEHGVTGFLTHPTPARVIMVLRSASLDRNLLAQMRAEVLRRPVRSRHEMVQDYRALLPEPESSAPQTVEPPTNPHPPDQQPNLPGPWAPAVEGRWIWISPEATWRKAAGDFLGYTLRKARQSPRVPGIVRGLLRRL